MCAYPAGVTSHPPRGSPAAASNPAETTVNYCIYGDGTEDKLGIEFIGDRHYYLLEGVEVVCIADIGYRPWYIHIPIHQMCEIRGVHFPRPSPSPQYRRLLAALSSGYIPNLCKEIYKTFGSDLKAACVPFPKISSPRPNGMCTMMYIPTSARKLDRRAVPIQY